MSFSQSEIGVNLEKLQYLNDEIYCTQLAVQSLDTYRYKVNSLTTSVKISLRLNISVRVCLTLLNL